jgi:PAS domain S-box-containing protein
MPQFLARSAPFLALLLSTLVLYIGATTHDVALTAPVWLLLVLVLSALAAYMGREVDRLQQLQRELQASEQQYRILSEGAGEVVWAVGPEDDVLYVSPSVAHLRGYTRAEMMAMSWEQRIAGGLNPEIVAAVHRHTAALRAGNPLAAEVIVASHTHRAGHPLWVETSIAPLPAATGGFAGVRIVSRDVSAREEARQALQRSEARFAKLFHANPAAIVLSRWEDGVYLDVNATFAALSGYSRAELIGQTSVSLGLLEPAARATLVDIVKRQGFARGLDMPITTKEGAVLHVLYSIELIEVEGVPALLSICFDITDRKRMEEELLALNEELRTLNEELRTLNEELRTLNEELQTLNEELEERVARRTADLQTMLELKNEFLAMMSHELRTPLTGVLTLAELLQQETGDLLTLRQADYVAGIVRSGRRLLEIINSILSYTQLISGDVVLEREPCNLAYLLKLAAASMRHKTVSKEQELVVAVDPPQLTIVSDSNALVQVCKRLLDNASKFTPAGGRISLTAEVLPGKVLPGEVQPPGPAPTRRVRIVVADTGVGLPGGMLPEATRPFIQLDSTLARRHEGIGMGLAYVDQLLPLLGGTLAYEPNPGGGSRFIVTLPA